MLKDQYPSVFQEWVNAGYEELAFREHLLGIGVLAPTPQDLIKLAQRSLAQAQGMLGRLGEG